MNAAAGARGTRYRAAVAARVGLAAFGGYALAASSTALLALILPLERAEAVTAATMLSFVVLVGAVVYVFAARSLAAALVGIGMPLIALGGALWLALATLPAGAPT